MIQYRKSDGSLGNFDSDKQFSVSSNGHSFTITITHYGWDEYDFWHEEITDIIELRIG